MEFVQKIQSVDRTADMRTLVVTLEDNQAATAMLGWIMSERSIKPVPWWRVAWDVVFRGARIR